MPGDYPQDARLSGSGASSKAALDQLKFQYDRDLTQRVSFRGAGAAGIEKLDLER